MARSKLVKCRYCKQLHPYEPVVRTLCGNCGHELQPRRGHCRCARCLRENPVCRQAELFDVSTGKALAPARPNPKQEGE